VAASAQSMSGDAGLHLAYEREPNSAVTMAKLVCFLRPAAVPWTAGRIGVEWSGLSHRTSPANRPRRLSLVATAGGRAAASPAQNVGAASSAVHSSPESTSASVGDLHTSATGIDGEIGRRKQRFSPIGVIFICITYIVGSLFFLPMLIAHPFVMLLDRKRRRFHDYAGMFWLKLSLSAVGIFPEVVGSHNLPAPGTACVFVANHSSNMDVFAMSFLDRAVKCVVKSDIFKMPVFGWAIWMAGNIGVKRLNRSAQIEVFRRMVAALQHGVALVVYPEGTRSATGRLGRFKPGAFSAAKAANVPIVPVTITGTRDMMPSHAYVPLCYPPRRFRLTIHPAIDSLGQSVDELRDMAYRAIDSQLDPSLQSLSHS
jgi:1-acyl-sn-glycerol-3-phosphate acyltransferase